MNYRNNSKSTEEVEEKIEAAEKKQEPKKNAKLKKKKSDPSPPLGGGPNQSQNRFVGEAYFAKPYPTRKELLEMVESINQNDSYHRSAEFRIVAEVPQIKAASLAVRVHVNSSNRLSVEHAEEKLSDLMDAKVDLKVVKIGRGSAREVVDQKIQRLLGGRRCDVVGLLNLSSHAISTEEVFEEGGKLEGLHTFTEGFSVWKRLCGDARLNGAIPRMLLVVPEKLNPEPYVRILVSHLWESGLSDIPGFISGPFITQSGTDASISYPYFMDLRDDVSLQFSDNCQNKNKATTNKVRGEGTFVLGSARRGPRPPGMSRDDGTPQTTPRPLSSYAAVYKKNCYGYGPSSDDKKAIRLAVASPRQLDASCVEDGLIDWFPAAVMVDAPNVIYINDYEKLCRLTGIEGSELDYALQSYRDAAMLTHMQEEVNDKEANSTDNEDAFAELDALIGLNSVKQQIREIAALLEKRGRDSLPCIHMAFKGNPGTAKTTVARITAKIFSQIGVSSNPNAFVETDSTGMIAQYVGQTAPLVKNTVKRAQGGVLFIDEAYGIAPQGNAGGRSYANEALATLVKELEDKRDNFVCIMAGYTQEMNSFIDMNPGLRDRIAFHIDFPDYSATELVEIFEKLACDAGYSLSTAAPAVLQKYFEKALAATDKNFSNGRLVRKLFERARFKQAVRSSSNILTVSDIQEALSSSDFVLEGVGSASFGFVREQMQS